MSALRFNEGKPKLSYFRRSFGRALEGVARVMEFGANKYADGNWRLGGKPDTEYLDSMDRHMALFLSGEVYDQDSGCHHLSLAIWNMCALLELNHADEPAVDKELFKERMAHWAAEKEKAATKEKEETAGALTQADINEVLRAEHERSKREYANGKEIHLRTEETPMPECMKTGKAWEVEPTSRETEWVDDLNNWIKEHREEQEKDEVPELPFPGVTLAQATDNMDALKRLNDSKPVLQGVGPVCETHEEWMERTEKGLEKPVTLLPLPPMPETHAEMIARLQKPVTNVGDVNITFEIKDGERCEAMDELMATYGKDMVKSIRDNVDTQVVRDAMQSIQADMERQIRDNFFRRFDTPDHKSLKGFEV